jgi:membrane protease YdiL (CAAX protease family)
MAEVVDFRDMHTGPPRPQALLEVCLCSGFPTQLLVVAALALGGMAPPDGTGLSLPYVIWVAGLDTILLVGLVITLLSAGGESPRQVLLGERPIAWEVLRGFTLLPWVFGLLAITALSIDRWAPWLVTPNPLESLATTRAELVLFGVTTIIAGGVREEIQRAFIIHRCEQRLGGAIVGVVGFGLIFGLGHLVQGYHAVIITALLGTLWSVVYVLRRSIVAPMVSHASFNLIEVIGFGLRA